MNQLINQSNEVSQMVRHSALCYSNMNYEH